MGIKTQVPSLFNGISVCENVRMAARRKHLKPMARDKAEEMMEKCGVVHLARREVGLLAHGQRQLVELAMVLAEEPPPA